MRKYSSHFDEMNKQKQTRKILSWLLLIIFISTTTLQTLHHHDPLPQNEKVCMMCVKHLPHAGHFTDHLTTPCNCLLCQFCGIPFLVPTLTTLPTLFRCQTNFSSRICPTLFPPFHHKSSPRAPPFHSA